MLKTDKNNKLIGLIEYDGEQHYKPYCFSNNRKNFEKNLEKNRYRDYRKYKFTDFNNIPLLRIPYFFKDYYEILITNYLKYLEVI